MRIVFYCFGIMFLCLTPSLPNAGAEEPSRVSTTPNRIDARRDIVEVAARVDEDDRRLRANFEAKEESRVSTPTHSDLLFVFSGQRATLRLIFDSHALKQPVNLLPDAILFAYFKNYSLPELKGVQFRESHLLKNAKPPSSDIFGFGELLENARSGDVSAQLRLARWRAEALRVIQLSDEFEEEFPGSRKHLGQRLSEETTRIEHLQNLVLSRQSRSAMVEALNLLDGVRSQLEDMVLQNDRHGVAQLLRATLPWSDMSLTEARGWNLWLEAIEHPDLSNSLLLFRGIGYQEKLAQGRVGGADRYAFFSTLISRRLGSNLPRLKGLLAVRHGYGDSERTDFSPPPPEYVVRLSDLMHAHAEADLSHSLFISTTPDIHRTGQFVTGSEERPGPLGSLLAVKVDRRRVAFNVGSSWKEYEHLVPLLIFPDEVIHFEPRFDSRETSLKRFTDEVARKSGMDHEALEGLATRENGYAGTDLFQSMISNQGARPKSPSSCRALFGKPST